MTGTAGYGRVRTATEDVMLPELEGPWEVWGDGRPVVGRGSYAREFLVRDISSGKVVVYTRGDQLEPDGISIGGARTLAEAVSALPDMVKALEAARHEVNLYATSVADSAKPYRVLDQIDAVLAKVRTDVKA